MIPAVLGLAVVDSLNPSAIAVTLYLVASGRDVVRRVATYIGAIYLTYLTIGLALVAGLDVLSATGAGDLLQDRRVYAAQLVLGAAALLYALCAPSQPRRRRTREMPSGSSLPAVFVLGVAVSAAEFPTALPYLAAIAVITREALSPLQYVPVLLVYNAVLVLPPLLILLTLRGPRSSARLDRWRDRLSSGSRTTFLTVLGLLGFVLLADALVFFEFFGLVDLPASSVPGGAL